MRPRMRLIVAITAITVAALVALMVAVTSIPRRVLTPITSIEYSQSKAVEGFTPFSYQTSDSDRIAAFTSLAKKYSIDVTHFDSALNDDCTGGLATDVSLDFADSTTSKLRVYDCGRTVPRGTFVSDASALFTRWRGADDK